MGFGVKRSTVFDAFRAKKLDFVFHQEEELVEIAGPNGELWTEYIPQELGRREPQRLADKFGIPIQWFYQPLMIPSKKDKKPPN